MESNAYLGDRSTPERGTALRLSTYEHAVARQRLEEAMLFGDLALRAMDRVRTALRGVRHALS